MNARAWPMWLLPFVLSACAAEPARTSDAGDHTDAATPDANIGDSGARDHDDGSWPEPTYAPTFSAIFNETFERNLCTSVFCHGIGGATLDFSSQRAAYDSLVDQMPTGVMCKDQGLVIVVPGDPAASLLMSKLQDMEPACGARMPRLPGVTVDPREIAQVQAWIALGAHFD